MVCIGLTNQVPSMDLIFCNSWNKPAILCYASGIGDRIRPENHLQDDWIRLLTIYTLLCTENDATCYVNILKRHQTTAT